MKILNFGTVKQSKNGLQLDGFRFEGSYKDEPFTYAGAFKAVIDYLLRAYKDDDAFFQPVRKNEREIFILNPGKETELSYPDSDSEFGQNDFTEVDETIYQLVALQIGNVLTTECGLIPGSVELHDINDFREYPKNVVGYCLTLEDPPRYFLRTMKRK